MNAAAFAIGNWTPHIGDPSVMGWLTVCSYYAIAAVTLLLGLCTSPKRNARSYQFTLIVFICMGLLGICKQFNAPSALTELARIFLSMEGLMEQRRIVQACIIMAFIAVLWGLLRAISKSGWQTFQLHKLTFACLVYLIAFVMLRAISLHQYEAFLGYEILGLRINWIGELLGIYAVGVAVFLEKKA